MVARGRDLEEDDWRAFGLGIATQISHVVTLARAYEEREQAERRATEHAALLDAMIAERAGLRRPPRSRRHDPVR